MYIYIVSIYIFWSDIILIPVNIRIPNCAVIFPLLYHPPVLMRMPDVSGWVLMMRDYGSMNLPLRQPGKLRFRIFHN